MTIQGRKEIEIAHREHRPVSLIYLDSKGTISQRVVQVTGVTEEGIQAYCYLRKKPRTFRADQILAASLQARKTITR
ncbi:WYL domain-containing protein [Tumebacillus lipolyticus]|uniref:WYL domain-containing protein n=1 Tax=Tumebacillus lipolyticus TaxID=1280370 RepID=A0ABW4ZZB3_9BACL